MAYFDDFIQPLITLTIDKGRDCLELSYDGPTRKKLGISLTVTQDQIKLKLIHLREELSKWAKKYEDLLDENKGDKLSCDPSKVKDMWVYLATEGGKLYRLVFDLYDKTEANLIKLAKNIRKIDFGSIIELDTLAAPLPWGLLHDGVIPSSGDPHFFDKLISHFWGIRYQLIAHPPWGSTISLSRKPPLPNSDGTRLTVAINQQSDMGYQTGQMTFFKGMEEKFDTIRIKTIRNGGDLLMLGTSKEQVVSNLTVRQEPQHLCYFFCHHEKGEGETNIHGYDEVLQQTQIIMEGEEQGVITLDELSENRAIRPFKSPPVIFLNACQSTQLKIGDPTSFMTYFIRRLGSFSYIGTEAEIPAPFADAFGKCFVRNFLSGGNVGKILFDMRNRYASQHLNPFGLYYTLFGRGDVHLINPVTEITYDTPLCN